MGVTTTKTNKPFNPRGNDQSPLAFNKAAIYSGKALSFDGVNDYVTISDNPAVDLGTGDFSIAFVMKSSAAGNARIIDKRNGTSGYTLYINTAKELILELNDTTGNAGFTTSTIYADGKLKHVVISADRNGKANFYINGALNESVDISSKSGNLDSTSNLLIGADAPAGDSLYFNGQMAGLKIFNTALTPAQVADLYNFPENIVPTGVANTALKLWLPMQEGAGTTAYNGAPNALGSELITNGDFSDGATDWDLNRGWSVSNNTLIHDGSVTTAQALQNISINGSAGTIYVLTFNVLSSTTNAELRFYSPNVGYISNSLNSGDSAIYLLESDGSYNYLVARNYSGAEIILDNISVKEISNNGTISGATYVNGIGAPVAQTAVIDWNKHTLDGTNAVLIPQGLTSGRDLLGNLFTNVRKQSALNLDGNSWAEVHDNASLDMTTAVTLEAWVKCGDELTLAEDHIFVKQSSDGSWASPYGRYALRLRQNAIQWWFNSYTSAKLYTTSLSGWNHLVVTKNGASEILYLNGIQVDTNTGASSITVSDYSLLIGSRTGHSAAEMFANQLAQPRIYNRALTAEEVQRNYDAGKNIYTN